jgi:hypothetical protein
MSLIVAAIYEVEIRTGSRMFFRYKYIDFDRCMPAVCISDLFISPDNGLDDPSVPPFN